MDMNITLLALASDARLADISVLDVVDALDVAKNLGFSSIIKGNHFLAIANMKILCSISDIYVVNGKHIAVGNPCYIGATGRLNVWRKTIAVAKADRAIVTEIVGDDITENAICRD